MDARVEKRFKINMVVVVGFETKGLEYEGTKGADEERLNKIAVCRV